MGSFCKGCGKCCYDTFPGFDGIRRNQISKATGLAPDEFSELTYERKDENFHIQTYTFRHRQDGSCYFLDKDRTCGIYTIKPDQCDLHRCFSSILITDLRDAMLDDRDIEWLAERHGKHAVLEMTDRIMKRAEHIELSQEDSAAVGKGTLKESIVEYRVQDNKKVMDSEHYDPAKPPLIREINRKYKRLLLQGLV